ncbi:MAG: hypothetical protein JST75_07535 [Bacteroidetes bacterium]|nr:hypothetical protein [Bacteroidota bacterium]
MRSNFFILLLQAISCFLTNTFSGFGQMNKSDSAFYQSAVSHAINIYQESTGDQNPIYNGSLYYGYPFRFKQGNALFLPDTILVKGTVVYDNILYKDIPLEYDNLQDLVITKDSLYWIQLNGKKITAFSISGHSFVRLEKNASNKDLVTTGFYEILHEGALTVFKKEIKMIHEEPSIVEGLERSVFTSPYYYIKKEGVIYPVKDQDDIGNILQNKKKEIRQFLRKNKLKFRKDKDNTLLEAVIYYEQTTKQI